MKNVGKSIVFIVAILALALCLTSFLGIYTSYGDVTRTVVSGAKESVFGLDFDPQADLVLKPADAEAPKLNEQEMQLAKEVFERRLEWFVLPEYQVYTDTENARVLISAAWNAETATYSPTDILGMITAKGEFEVRKGNDTDVDGNPTGVTENVILTNEHVRSARPIYNNPTGIAMFATYEVEVTLTAEGRRLLKEAVGELESLNESAHYITVWVDGTKESVISIANLDFAKLNMANTNYTNESTTKIALAIESGALPAAFAADTSSYSVVAPFGEDSILALMIGCVVAIGLLFIYMIFRYRLTGLVAMIALAGFAGGVMAFITGFVGEINRPQNLSLAAVGAIIVVLFMSIYLIVRDAEAIKQGLNGGKSVSRAVGDAIKENSWNSIRVFVVLGALGLIIYGLFLRTGSFVSSIINPVTSLFGFSNNSMFQAFGLLLMAGSLFGILFSVVGFRFMMGSLSNYKRLKNTVLFGGAGNDEE